ncbi:MAG TPA: carbohydrate porin, partial [Polyangiales bacterium]
MPIRHRLTLAALALLVCTSAHVRADDGDDDDDASDEDEASESNTPQWLSLHFQFTVATQAHPAFAARYTGANSLHPSAQSATAFVSTLYLDGRLWPGAELIVNPEFSGGAGLSSTLGVAAFPSGLTYRVGDPAPAIYLARLLLRQTIELGGGREQAEAGANQLAGAYDSNTLTFSLGRLSIEDVFDGNAYAHDPTTQFFNWALFASGAWDYPADTRGYTWGLLADLRVNWWSIRAGFALEPKYANLATMDWRIDKSHGLVAEYEARYRVAGRAGTARFLAFANEARMGSYREVLDDPAKYDDAVTATRRDGRWKYGFAFSVDQQINDTLGAFLRGSANDGATESWAFTEIDRSLGFGLVQSGRPWCRADDKFGVAIVIDGLSQLHRRYLAGGGYGFIIGD